MVYAAAELRAVVDDADRLSAGHEGKHYVWLLKQAPSAAVRAELESLADDHARVGLSERAVHLLVDGGYLDSTLLRPVEKRIGVATNRNVTVLRALVSKWCS